VWHGQKQTTKPRQWADAAARNARILQSSRRSTILPRAGVQKGVEIPESTERHFKRAKSAHLYQRISFDAGVPTYARCSFDRAWFMALAA